MLGAGRQVCTAAGQGGFFRAFASPTRARRRAGSRAPLAGNVVGETAGTARAHAGHCM